MGRHSAYWCVGEGGWRGMLVCPVSRVAVVAFAALLLQAAVLAALPRDTLSKTKVHHSTLTHGI